MFSHIIVHTHLRYATDYHNLQYCRTITITVALNHIFKSKRQNKFNLQIIQLHAINLKFYARLR